MAILRIKEVGLEYSIQIRIQKGSDTIHSFLILQKWILFSMRNSIPFIGMVKATPEKFQFSVKVPETITYRKRLDVRKGAITDFEIFFDIQKDIIGTITSTAKRN
jgi:hypothetical protein